MKLLKLKRKAALIGLITLSACAPPDPKPAGDPLVAKGRDLFFKETFDGNGRTCGTCHRAENNLTIDPAFIATLPNHDPLFVAEFIPSLAKNFENPVLMRKRGLILENLDGVDDLARNFVMRGVPHVFSQGISINSNPRNRLECFSDTLCPRTGWSGDGAPQTKDLRAFARGAVTQHFTKTTNRKEGVDFRPPTEDEEKALEAFQLSLGRQEELKLPLPLKSAEALQGQEIFNSPTTGKCFRCHANAGANVPAGGPASGNLNFNTGVENLPDPTGDFSQPDDGLGITPAGDGTFNTPSLVEAADTGPFFHNNSVETIEGAVGFYNTDAFNNSPSGQFLSGGTGRGIALDATQVKAVAAFLRAINALDNIRELNKLLGAVEANVLLAGEHPEDVVKRAVNDIDDAIMVLKDGGLHPDAVQRLQEARGLTVEAATSPRRRIKLAKQALDAINQAKGLIVG
jgi:mono/diheme cytochrome c family protein